MAPSSETPFCDVIYVYYKVEIEAVKNQEEVYRLVRNYVLLMQQQQAFNEIYEGLEKMYNDIVCSLNVYDDAITPFEAMAMMDFHLTRTSIYII